MSLYDTEGDYLKETGTASNMQDHGYDFVHFNYDGDLFTDARIDKVSVDEDSIQYTLMFNPDSNSSDSMEEFSPDLVETGNGDSMEEVDLEPDNE